MSGRILLVGEPMGLFISEDYGSLDQVEHFSLATCGAELNVAIGLSRLGHSVTYMTKLGHDLFGQKITASMEASGISTDAILWSDTHPTGFMFKSKVESGDPDICYFRKGSAASTLSIHDISGIDLSAYDAVHITGITPALTDSTRAAILSLIDRSKAAGVFLSFDPNLRLQLWKSAKEMQECIHRIASLSDLFLPGINEAEILMGSRDPETIAGYYRKLGAKTVVIKTGSAGAYYAAADDSAGMIPGYPVEKVVDTVGAGDGFAVGILSGLQEGLPLEEAIRRGNAIGAIQVMSKGDNDGLPTREELTAFMAGRPDWRAAG